MTDLFIAKVSPACASRIVRQRSDGLGGVVGWAYSGGGSWVERVEVSIDGGFIWHEVNSEFDRKIKRTY